MHGELHAAGGAGAVADAFLMGFDGRFADAENQGDLLVAQVAERQSLSSSGRGQASARTSAGSMVAAMIASKEIRASNQDRSPNPRQGA
jgi:hypothetical protein